MRNLVMAVLISFGGVNLAAQTFEGTVIAGSPNLYSFTSADRGQYEATLVWDDSSDMLQLAILCDDDRGDPQILGVAAGFRDRTARLSVGIPDTTECVIGISILDILIADYTLNLQVTTGGAEKSVSLRHAAQADRARVESTFQNLVRDYRSLRETIAASEEAPLKAGNPTTTFLDRIVGEVSQTFVVDAIDDVLEITAMWNRSDTDLSVGVSCGNDDTVVDIGISESGQERFLRFDADVIAGTTCTVTLRSPNTMVYALNLAFYGNGGLTQDGSGGDDQCTPASQCCRICSAGKACGNSCISRGSTCHQPPGCACNQSDVCA